MRTSTKIYWLMVLVCLAFMAEAAMAGRWFAMVAQTAAAAVWVFQATHPREWWDGVANRVVERLERRA